MSREWNVLVTDAHATSTLAVVRSLGAHGMHLTVAGEQGRSNLAAYSRFASRTLLWPRAEEHPFAYLDRLEDELQAGNYDLLVPTTDTSLTLVRHRRERLEQLVRVALPSEAALSAAQDKAATIRIAREAAVAVPRTWCFSSLLEVEKAAAEIRYPCVLKPRFSCRWSGERLVRETVRYADSADALLKTFRSGPHGAGDLLVQELVAGTGVGVFALTDAGKPLAVFAHRRVREATPTGGRASLAESIAPAERLIGPALRILAALEWTGVAMIEFKDPGEPSDPVLMEINGRFWGSLPLAVASGVDFPVLLTRLILGRPEAHNGPYRVGVRCRHLKGDISYLVAALKGRPRHWKGPYPTRLGALAAVAPWPFRWHPYNFRFTDPVPALYEAGAFLQSEFSRIRERAAGIRREGQ